MAMEPPVVFENASFLAIDKPAGWLSVPGRVQPDATPCASAFAAAKSAPFTIHRLDQPVSGLLLFAKTTDAHRAASLWFEKRTVKKTYEALTRADASLTPGQTFEWKSRLLRGKKRAYEKPFGAEAITRATYVGPLPDEPDLALWRLVPLTGRSHQLRFELAKHGYPIVGDITYGGTMEGGAKTESIGLRAVRLDFGECPGAENLLPNTLSVESMKWSSGPVASLAHVSPGDTV